MDLLGNIQIGAQENRTICTVMKTVVTFGITTTMCAGTTKDVQIIIHMSAKATLVRYNISNIDLDEILN